MKFIKIQDVFAFRRGIIISKCPLFLVVGLFVLLISACGDDCEETIEAFRLSENRAIEMVSDRDSVIVGDTTFHVIEYQVVDGQDRVFEYNLISQVCDDDVFDAGGGRNFTMVVPADSTSTFSYTDSEILSTSAFVNFTGFTDRVNQFVEEGEIIGTRIDDNNWQVSIDVVTTLQEYGVISGVTPLTIDIDTIFTLEL